MFLDISRIVEHLTRQETNQKLLVFQKVHTLRHRKLIRTECDGLNTFAGLKAMLNDLWREKHHHHHHHIVTMYKMTSFPCYRTQSLCSTTFPPDAISNSDHVNNVKIDVYQCRSKAKNKRFSVCIFHG